MHQSILSPSSPPSFGLNSLGGGGSVVAIWLRIENVFSPWKGSLPVAIS